MLDARRTLVLIAFLSTAAFVCPGLARAYSPDVAAAIARRATEALPLAAQWDPSWIAVVIDDIERGYEIEDRDAEAAAPSHRYGAGHPVSHPASLELSEVGWVFGWAPRALVEAHEALGEAFAQRQAARIARAVGRVAVSVADLADPYLVTPPERVEMPGVRARFSDLFERATLDDLDAPDDVSEVSDPHSAALELASASAAARGAIEEAAGSGDAARFSGLRRERLVAALSLARRLVVRAWLDAGSPSLADAATRVGSASVRPNPARGATAVSFTLPSAGEARLEVFDVEGRRVWSGDLGRLPAGPHEVTLGERTIRMLPAGLFLVRVRTAAHEALGRMLRLRP